MERRSTGRSIAQQICKTRSPSSKVSIRSLFQMMLTTNRLCVIWCRYALRIQRHESADVSSSSLEFNSTIKQLIASRQYKQALNFFDRQSTLATDVTLSLALKASAELADEQRGLRIHRQLSSSSLHKAYIQTSLIHFYSQCSSLSSR